MGTTDQEMNSRGEVVESPLHLHNSNSNNNNNKNSNIPFTSLGRQSSIYSLTLDEFQHTLCEGGKNFGSMNMDEFLNSIWTAEENQATGGGGGHAVVHNSNPPAISMSAGVNNNGDPTGSGEPGRGISKQTSLPRQGSLTLPEQLCRKTVDEVWSEIHNGRINKAKAAAEAAKSEGNSNSSRGNVRNADSTPRQPTFGEMTLEDFLVKAGVVREQQCGAAAAAAAAAPPLLPPQQQSQYGMYQSGGGAVAAGFLPRSIGSGGAVGNYQSVLPQTGGPMGESSGRNGGYAPQQPPPPPAAVYGGRVGNGIAGGGGYAPAPLVGPVSPVSSDGMVANVDAVGNQYGMDMSGLRSRKRIIDGPVEKVVERRQRRMIKNRESAARSRARKQVSVSTDGFGLFVVCVVIVVFRLYADHRELQAYTVELEAELNQLKDENKQLKQALVELERKRKQQYVEELRTKGQSKAQKARERLRLMRRNLSCPL
ncbi:unnamed protein product [Linum tenue]|uniref:BZIP domain-containing protein n=1 Tax=Linum tenue TaxID=586396 RepID=A0AAV0I2L0_9ROSI|nr:unnamed protein product [Linum tenue]